MPFIEWTEEIRVGIDEVDEQHRKLFDMLNRLYDSVTEGKEQSTLVSILDDLVEYTVYHFNTEEKFFAEYEFPGFEEHKAAHDNLTGTAVDLQAKLKEGSASISFELLDFLHGWLAEHTSGLDKEFGDFLAAR